MMKKDMADSVSVTWQLLFDDHGFTREHYNQLKKFSSEVLREIIAEIACCHPSTAKWHLNRSQFGIRIDHDLAAFFKVVVAFCNKITLCSL
ncbi:hypothetical protein HEM29_018720, partial [Escherichia coli]|nr:hypothetical protein [Escherichia coli]